MRGQISRTIKKTAYKVAEVTIAHGKLVTKNEKVLEFLGISKPAMAIAKYKKDCKLPNDANVVVVETTEEGATYAMSLDEFMNQAKLVPQKTDENEESEDEE